MKRQPRHGLAESGIWGVVPRHGRPRRIAAETDAWFAQLLGIASLVEGNIDLADAELIALVERRRTSQSQQQHRRDTSLRVAELGGNPRIIVAGDDPVGPASGRKRSFVIGDHLAKNPRVPWRFDQLEVEGQMYSRPFASVVAHQLIERQDDLADQQSIAIFVSERAEVGRKLMNPGLVG